VAALWMSSFGMQLYFLTIYLQQVLHESPLRAGLSFLSLAISIVAGTRMAGRLVGRIGIARTLAAGMAFGAVGLFLYLRLPADGSLADLIPGMIVAGLGQGTAFTTMYVAASTGVPQGNEGVASASAMTAQQLGGSVGLALLVALLTERVTALGGTISASSISPLTSRPRHCTSTSPPRGSSRSWAPRRRCSPSDGVAREASIGTQEGWPISCYLQCRSEDGLES
jgi:MFS family permease